jgi:hypothetical protein
MLGEGVMPEALHGVNALEAGEDAQRERAFLLVRTVRRRRLILVSRSADGKIRVDDDFHETRKGAKWGR